MKLYIYKEQKRIKERIVLPNGKSLSLEFPAVINAFSRVSPYPDNYNLRVLIHKFYENLSPLALEWLQAEEKSLLNKVEKTIAKRIEETLKKPWNNPYELVIRGMELQKEIFEEVPYNEGYETFIEYDKFLDIKPGEVFGLSPNLESFFLESVSVNAAIQSWLVKAGGKIPSERFIRTNNITQSLSDFMNADITSVALYKAIQAATKNSKSTNEETKAIISAQGTNSEFHDSPLILYKSFETRNQQVHTSIYSLNKERKRRKSTVKYKAKVDEKEIQTDFDVINIFSRVYTSERGLLPLLWAEIIYAVENNLYLEECFLCKKWFVPTTKYRFCSVRCYKTFSNSYDRLRQQKRRAKNEEDKRTIQQEINKLLKNDGGK